MLHRHDGLGSLSRGMLAVHPVRPPNQHQLPLSSPPAHCLLTESVEFFQNLHPASAFGTGLEQWTRSSDTSFSSIVDTPVSTIPRSDPRLRSHHRPVTHHRLTHLTH